MLTLVHNNPVVVSGDQVLVDRKFHQGLLALIQHLAVPVTSVHPAAGLGTMQMDPVQIPRSGDGYELQVLDAPSLRGLRRAGRARLDSIIRRSQLVAGRGYGFERLARRARVPYVIVLEYDLPSQLAVTRALAASPLRQAWRALRVRAEHRLRDLPARRAAYALHCCGYPVYEECARLNARRLLYFDTRLAEGHLIAPAVLEARLAQLGSRPLRVLYSGRYAAIKGALDAVKVAVAALRLGARLEFHCYGQGELAEAMRELAASADAVGCVHIHPPVPFETLLQIAQGFDLFLACHGQSDPSCTYLETLGCGVPILGYDNLMWRRMRSDSGAGWATAVGDVNRAAAILAELAADPLQLAEFSRRAVAFAARHTFESAIASRAAALNEILAEVSGSLR